MQLEALAQGHQKHCESVNENEFLPKHIPEPKLCRRTLTSGTTTVSTGDLMHVYNQAHLAHLESLRGIRVEPVIRLQAPRTLLKQT